MALVDYRFYFVYKDGDKLYPQLYPSETDNTKWVFHVSPLRNALGHGKEAENLMELKYYVLELGWRMRARSDEGRNGSYARYSGGVKSHVEDSAADAPNTSSAKYRIRTRTSLTPSEAIGSKGGLKDGEKDENGSRRRTGQGRYKLAVVDLWKTCSVTSCSNANLLVASHIIAHKDSETHEKLDPFNGLLLTPNLDRLFDRGLISFDVLGKILIARRLEVETQLYLGIHSEMWLRFIPPETAKYLVRHREKFFERDAVRS